MHDSEMGVTIIAMFRCAPAHDRHRGLHAYEIVNAERRTLQANGSLHGYEKY